MAASMHTRFENSDDDEKESHLKADVDKKLNIKVDGIKKAPRVRNAAKGHQHLRSLRASLYGDVDDHRHGQLETTPEFQDHIAKKLDSVLQSEIIMETISRPLCEHDEVPENVGGVKLLSASENDIINCYCEPNPAPKKRSKQKVETSSDSDSEGEKEKFASAAVSSDFILQNSAIHVAAENNNSDAGDSSNKRATNIVNKIFSQEKSESKICETAFNKKHKKKHKRKKDI